MRIILILVGLLVSMPVEAATRTYTRTGNTATTVNPIQLCDSIDTALARTGSICSANPTTIFVTHASLVPADDATINSVISAYVHDPAYVTGAENVAARASANVVIGSKGDLGKVLRSAAKVLVDEGNLTRQWITQFKAAVAAATTLADLKTRVAALPDMPDRTLQQAYNAILNNINTGSVDAAP